MVIVVSVVMLFSVRVWLIRFQQCLLRLKWFWCQNQIISCVMGIMKVQRNISLYQVFVVSVLVLCRWYSGVLCGCLLVVLVWFCVWCLLSSIRYILSNNRLVSWVVLERLQKLYQVLQMVVVKVLKLNIDIVLKLVRVFIIVSVRLVLIVGCVIGRVICRNVCQGDRLRICVVFIRFLFWVMKVLCVSRQIQGQNISIRIRIILLVECMCGNCRLLLNYLCSRFCIGLVKFSRLMKMNVRMQVGIVNGNISVQFSQCCLGNLQRLVSQVRLILSRVMLMLMLSIRVRVLLSRCGNWVFYRWFQIFWLIFSQFSSSMLSGSSISVVMVKVMGYQWWGVGWVMKFLVWNE